MIKLATDENFNGKIIRGLRRRNPNIDIVRVQDNPVKDKFIIFRCSCL